MDDVADFFSRHYPDPSYVEEVARIARITSPGDRPAILREAEPLIEQLGRAAMRRLSDEIRGEGMATAARCAEIADTVPVFPQLRERVEERVLTDVSRAHAALDRHQSN